MPRHLVSNLLGLVGAIVGGVLGFYTFGWLVYYGYYGLMIPGAFLGLGCSLAASHPSMIRGLLCGIAAVGLAIFTEWKYWPFAADESFSFLVTHLTSKGPVTLLMIGVGAFIAFWVGKDSGINWSARPGASSRPE